MKVNIPKLKGRLKEEGITYLELANRIGIARDTVTHRMEHPETFKLIEVQRIMEILGLSSADTMEIFFAKERRN